MFRELYGAPAPARVPVPLAPPAPAAPPGTLLTEAGLRRVLPGVLRGAQNINVADLGRTKAIFSEFPHVAKAVSDKIIKNQTVLRMNDEQLVNAERDLVASTSKTERRMQEAYSRE